MEIKNKLESEIAAKRSDSAINKVSETANFSDTDLEEMLAARRSARKEKAAGFCPNCGKPVMKSDKFCPSCGKTLI
jgi:rubrerythrin